MSHLCIDIILILLKNMKKENIITPKLLYLRIIGKTFDIWTKFIDESSLCFHIRVSISLRRFFSCFTINYTLKNYASVKKICVFL